MEDIETIVAFDTTFPKSIMAPVSLPVTSQAQWIFPLSALQHTPSRSTSDISLEKELYDRNRGVEFLFRMGVSLKL